MRSRSPGPIDRYQPGRPSRDDYHGRREEGYRRRTPPPVSQGAIDRYIPGQDLPAAPLVNPLLDPMKMDQQVGFSYFAEWWRKDQQIKEEREAQKQGRRPDRQKGARESQEEREEERKQIQAAYDAYKVQLQTQTSKIFVQLHKDEEWFKERYDPDIRDAHRRRLAEFRRGIYTQWETDLDSGVFDEFTLEGIYKSESNGAGGIVEKEEGETIAATEVLGVGDLLPSKGGDLRDPALDQPALLIKTIAPHVSREQLEVFCREHLGEEAGGFQWLSLSDPNSLKKFHRIGWVMLKPGGEEPTTPPSDDRGDGREEEGEEGEENAMVSEPAVKESSTWKALSEINGKPIPIADKGDFVCHVGVHIPSTLPRKKALWDLFSAPERVERDLQLAIRLVSKMEQELGEDVNGVNKVENRVEDIRSRGRLQSVSGNSTKPPKVLGESGEEGEDGEMDDDEEGAWDEETDDEDLLAKKKKLDLLVEYLRRVFNFCFFCVFESDSVHELARKCTGGHLRRPRASLTSAAKAAAKASAFDEPFPLKRSESSGDAEPEEGSPVAEKKFNRNNKSHHQLQRAFNWVKTYEEKLIQLLEPESADLKKLGGRPLDEAVEEELSKFVKREDEAKYRCKVPNCTKLFRGESFWKKHVEKRHDEWYRDFKKDVSIINLQRRYLVLTFCLQLNMNNLYVLDPAHITPSRSDPNNNGHFSSSNGMVNGTPRGFNMNMPFGFPGMPGGLLNPAGFPTTFGQYPVTMPGGLPSFGQNPSVDANGGFGPMRRGPQRFPNRPSGPYDRQSKDARNMRWNNGGRSSPPRGGPRMMNPPSRFADGSGAATVGPKEAVAGRNIKSYDDLDDVGTGGGTAELNY